MSGSSKEDLLICVTGLSRAGKTAFITAFVDALRSAHHAPGNFHSWDSVRLGLHDGADIEPPSGAIGMAEGFPHRDNRLALFGDPPAFPEATHSVRAATLVVRTRVPPGKFAKALGKLSKKQPEPRIRQTRITIVDYPGEWAIDLPMRGMSFADWSRETLALARSGSRRAISAQFLTRLADAKAGAPYSQKAARAAHLAFVEYLEVCRRDLNLSYLQPGHFLRPEKIGGRGDLLDNEAFCFFPIDFDGATKSPAPVTFAERLSARFEDYKARQVGQFFESLKGPGETRQVVLFDLLSAVASGQEGYEDARMALTRIAEAMRPKAGFLGALFGPTLRVLYAATKADHLHASARGAMQDHIEAMVPSLKPQKGRAGDHRAMALASISVTRDVRDEESGKAGVAGSVWVKDKEDPERGRILSDQMLTFPAPPARIPTDADWMNWERAGAIGRPLPDFRPEPARWTGRTDLPHFNLDAAIQFLVGDHV